MLTQLTFMITIISAQPADASADASVYTIPASETMPEPMSFIFEQARIQTFRGETKLSFRLPALLDGPEAQTFELEGSKPTDLVGSGAKGQCAVTTGRTDCQIQFDHLELDHEAANDFALQTGGKTFAEKVQAGREAFEHQAVGVVTIFHKK